MIKCRRKQAKDPQKLKKIVNDRCFVFCWWKREAIGVEAEAEAFEK